MEKPEFFKYDQSIKVAPAALLECAHLTPSNVDECLSEVQAKIASNLTAAFGVPPTCFDHGHGYSNDATATSVATSTKAEIDKSIRAMLECTKDIKAAHALPEWITQGRHRLASLLRLAGKVFDHNLAIQAKRHRLPPIPRLSFPLPSSVSILGFHSSA